MRVARSWVFDAQRACFESQDLDCRQRVVVVSGDGGLKGQSGEVEYISR